MSPAQVEAVLLMLRELGVRLNEVSSMLQPLDDVERLTNDIRAHVRASEVRPDEPIKISRAIELVGSVPADAPVAWGLSKPHLYRGDYSSIALEPSGPTTAGQLAGALVEALKRGQYCGWKGGTYRVDGESRIYVSGQGSYGMPLSENLLTVMLGKSTF